VCWRVGGPVDGGRLVECFDDGGHVFDVVVCCESGEREPDLCRGTGGYIYVLSCLYVFTLLLLRWGGHCEWFCVSTGLFTGCG
jgi:hypothetical protein